MGLRLEGRSLSLDTNFIMPPPFTQVISTTQPKRDDWVCVEWMVDPAAKEVRVWLDGREVDDLHLTNVVASGFGTVDVAVQHLAGGPVVDMWVDEVAVDTQRIGCIR